MTKMCVIHVKLDSEKHRLDVCIHGLKPKHTSSNLTHTLHTRTVIDGSDKQLMCVNIYDLIRCNIRTAAYHLRCRIQRWLLSSGSGTNLFQTSASFQPITFEHVTWCWLASSFARTVDEEGDPRDERQEDESCQH